MAVYSPELLTTETGILFLLKNDADNSSLIMQPNKKLLLLGMSEGNYSRSSIRRNLL